MSNENAELENKYNADTDSNMHKLIIRVAITKTAELTIDVPEDKLDDIRLEPYETVGDRIDAAFEAADEQYDDVSYDYQITDASNGYGIIIDWNDD